MLAYIIRRLFSGFIMLLLVSLATFILFFASGTDPARYACGKNCPPQQIEQTRKALGYDKPAPEQWVNFVKGIVAGREYPEDKSLAKNNPQLVSQCDAPCMGYSIQQQQTVTSLLKPAIPVSVSIAIAAFLLWMIIGMGIGVISALNKGKLIDKLLVGGSLLFYSFPTFFIGLVLLQYVAIKWQILPIPNYVPLTQNPFQWAGSLILPALTLALIYIAGYARITRSYVLESMSEDYLRTAKAKGLSNRTILFKHTLRAALTPIVSMAGIDLAALMGGAIITEQVFNYNGLGKLAVLATSQFDLPTTIGIVVLLSSIVILANIIVDVLYGFIDPRVKLI